MFRGAMVRNARYGLRGSSRCEPGGHSGRAAALSVTTMRPVSPTLARADRIPVGRNHLERQ